MTKVALIGENSIEFARNDIVGLCGMSDIGDLELALYDPDTPRLDHMRALADVIARQLGATASITAGRERAEALDGADYVVTELEVGGIKATREDFRLAKSYGVRQTDGHTIGIAGISRGLRTIPVSLSIAREMEIRCPTARLLNYTNPMAMTTWAIYQASAVPVLGLCHSVIETHRVLARLAGVPFEASEFLTAGVNHQAFVLRFDHDGRSMRSRVADVSGQFAGECPVQAEFFRLFGYVPTEQAPEYVPWIMRHDAEIARLRVGADCHEEAEAQNQELLARQQAEIAAGRVADLDWDEAVAPLVIHSLETGTAREIYVSARNDGRIANLPPEACVETPCQVGAEGIELAAVGALPPQLAALNRAFLAVAELTVLAVLDTRRDHVYHAALLDPNTAATLTTTQIVALCDDLMAAHRDLLPARLLTSPAEGNASAAVLRQ